MIGLLFRTVLVVVLIVAGGFLFLGYRAGQWGTAPASTQSTQPAPSPSVGTSGAIDTTKARERGAELGEKTAVAAAKAEETLAEGAITAKIKTKMALDETVKARSISVSTTRTTVTLTGTVDSAAEHERAVALARETAGVTHVVDHLAVRR
jgi:hyperosmotically inducible protein